MLDILEDDIFDDEFIFDEVCSLDVAEIEEEDDTDEFADELPESLDTTPDEVYDCVFVARTAEATSILFEECCTSKKDT